VSLANSLRKATFSGRYSDEVDVVVHQTPSDVLDTESLPLISELLQILSSIVVGEEDIHSTDTTLGDVMRDPWDYDTGNPGHTNSLSWMI